MTAAGELRMRSAPSKRGWISLAVALALTAALGAAQPAAAVEDFPTWDEVEQARQDETSQQALIDELEQLLVRLQSEAAAAETASVEKSDAYNSAQQASDDASFALEKIQAEADEAQKTADDSSRQASQLVAQLSRTGGTDLSVNLFLSGESADNLLYQLGAMSQLSKQASGIYERATQDRNTADALADQAAVARDELGALAKEAEAAWQEAVDASTAAQSAVDAQLQNQAQLEAQLSVLRENREATEADYQAGVRWRAEQEEARRQAEAEAARRAAQEEEERRAAAAAAQQQQQGQPPASASAPPPQAAAPSGGWARPTAARISSQYGQRLHPVLNYWRLHAGTDFAAACGSNVYAASAGTVTYAAYNGGNGYYIRIDHGGGLVTTYSHLERGGLYVTNGQQVAAGQLIGASGTTGLSTGCHLHFEVRQNGAPTDPVPYLRNRGVSF